MPALFNQPQQYAHFLGAELSFVYIDPLLTVMPAGFGIYDGGRSTAAESRVLADLPPNGTTASDLTMAAAAAVHQLTAAGALRSKDILAPNVAAQPGTVVRGSAARLRFAVTDDSGKSREIVDLLEHSGARLIRLRVPMRPVSPTRLASAGWRVPSTVHPGRPRMCVVAVDPAGNRSTKSCAPITVR